VGKKIVINTLQEIINRLQDTEDGYRENYSYSSESTIDNWMVASAISDKIYSIIGHKNFINHMMVAAIFTLSFYFLITQQFG